MPNTTLKKITNSTHPTWLGFPVQKQDINQWTKERRSNEEIV
jgi:hypothetical protein